MKNNNNENKNEEEKKESIEDKNIIKKDEEKELISNQNGKEKEKKSKISLKSKSKKEPLNFNNLIIEKEKLIPPECNKYPYIPQKLTNKNKTLVIDLDETLVHSYFEKEPPYEPDISYDIKIDGYSIHISTLIRPGAYQFLEEMSKLYEIVIFTASLSEYAIPLLDFIDKNKYCEHKLFREHCYIYENKGSPRYIKDLSKLNRDLNSLIILDNNPICYYFNKDNGIPIKTWLNDKNDRELFKIKPYLEFMSNNSINDVRPILSQIKDGKIIKFDIFDEIIENFNKNKKNEENIDNVEIKLKEDNINNENNYSKTIDSSKVLKNTKNNNQIKGNEKDNDDNFHIDNKLEENNIITDSSFNILNKDNINKNEKKRNIKNIKKQDILNKDILMLIKIQKKTLNLERFKQKDNSIKNNENNLEEKENINNNEINKNNNNNDNKESSNIYNDYKNNKEIDNKDIDTKNKEEDLDDKNRKQNDILIKVIDNSNNNTVETLNINKKEEKKYNSLEKNIKNPILNSLDRNRKKIFLKIKNNQKLNNNIKHINIFQKKTETIGTDNNTFNRYKNIIQNTKNNRLKTYIKRMFYDSKQKEKNEEKKINIKILNEKMENNYKIKLNEYEEKLNKFNFKYLIKNKNKVNENYLFNKIIKKANNNIKINEITKKNNSSNNNTYNNAKRKIRIDKNKHSHYNIGICLSDYNLDNQNNNSFNSNSKKKTIKLKINDTYKNENSNLSKSKSNNKNKDNKDRDNHRIEDLIFYKSKTMYNLSNKKEMYKKRLIFDKNKNNIKYIKKNISLDIQKNENKNIRNYLYSETNKIKNENNCNDNKNINININKTERNKTLNGKIISEFDSIIYSKKIKPNRKEYIKDKNKTKTENNKINIKNLDMNINNIFKFKLPLSKRINLYTGLENDFYKKGKIISFMNKVNKKSKNLFENKEYLRKKLNLQRLEQTKRFNFVKDKKRQGLSLGNVSKENKTPIIKIKSSYSSLE